MIIRLKLTNDRAIVPVQKPGDAGADLYACDTCRVPPGGTLVIDLGLAIEVPAGYAGFILPRSGHGSRGHTMVSPPIDSSYRGTIHAIAYNSDMGGAWTIRRGDRIAQLLILPVPHVEYEVCSELSETERGASGFGSSGI